MLEASNKDIKNFANLLRHKLQEAGCEQSFVNSFSDDQILDEYRTCCDCGDEIYTKDQQLHIILESDSAERAFELLYENNDDEDDDEDDEEETSWPELYSECNIDEDDEGNEVLIRGKWIFNGAKNIDEAIECLEDFKNYLLSLQEDGYELLGTIEDDYGFLRRK